MAQSKPKTRPPLRQRPVQLPPRSHVTNAPGPSPEVPAIVELQRLVGNRAVGGAIQRKLAYGDDWLAWKGWTWATGAKELWARLQPAFDDKFSPAFESLEDLVGRAAVTESDRAKFEQLRDTWGKYNSEKIPMAKGQTMVDKIEELTTAATELEKAIKHSITDRVEALEKSMNDVTMPFFQKYTNWSQMGIEGLADANSERKKLVGELSTKKRPGTILTSGELDNLKRRVETTTKAFVDAEAPAAEFKRKAEEDKELKALAPVETPVEEVVDLPDPLVKKAGSKQIAAALRSSGESDEAIIELLDGGKITAGRLSEVLRFATAATTGELLKVCKDAALLKLLRAIGSKGHEEQLLAIIKLAPRQEDDLEVLLNRSDPGSLATVKQILELFPSGDTRAKGAAELFSGATRSQEAKLLAILNRVGVGQAANVAAALKKTTAEKLDKMIDPAVGAHAFAFVHGELIQGHRIWAGETGAEPAYELANGTATTRANVIANAVNYYTHGYPAPNTGRFSSDRFNNNGGAGDMKLPTNTTYTEYDIREFTAPGDRGLKRIVIGANGNRYYTPDHYTSFVKF
ncbi:MAG: ribonuclease domain-containing protein [Dehalococcoidia bacterium]